MNIRRLKKITTPIRNEQEIAKDKLFQISYYSDQKYVDQSNILTFEPKQPDTSIQVHKRSQELEQVIKNKKIDNFTYLKRAKDQLSQSKLQGLRIETKVLSRTQNYIYNTVESNSVFVGSNFKAKEMNNMKNDVLFLDIKKKVKTMPSPQRQATMDFKKHLRTQENASQTINNSSMPYRYKKMYTTCNSLKRSYQSNINKLKQKIKSDLFVTTTFNYNFKHQ